MDNKSGIFIFSRDNPDKLIQALQSIQKIHYDIVVVDDSTREVNQITNRKIVSCLNYYYLGKPEFLAFIKRYMINLSEFSFLLRQLGDKSWNLGYTRNFALLFGKASGFENVLFMDDDIEVRSMHIVNELFELLKSYQFVGANIAGLVDDSVLGHIATDLNIFNERMLSGGFMAFRPSTINQFFLNYYNEDWIWLFLQLVGRQPRQEGEVFQAFSNPLDNYRDKVLFQEFGEILLDGILDCYPRGSFIDLNSQLFWERMVNERKTYLDTLVRSSRKSNNINYEEILEYIIENSGKYRASTFRNLFEEYFSNLRPFQILFNSLKV